VAARAAAQEALAQRLEAVRESRPMKATLLGATIAKLVDDDTIVISDSVTSAAALTDYMPRTTRYSYYSTSSGGCLGWTGAALGAKLAAPDKKVLCFVGDGVFQFGIQALFTCAKYNIPVTWVVANNGMFGAVKAGLLRLRGLAAAKGVFPGSDISGPNYAKIAEGFGIKGIRVDEPCDLEAVLRDAMARQAPVVVDVVIDQQDVGPVDR